MDTGEIILQGKISQQHTNRPQQDTQRHHKQRQRRGRQIRVRRRASHSNLW